MKKILLSSFIVVLCLTVAISLFLAGCKTTTAETTAAETTAAETTVAETTVAAEEGGKGTVYFFLPGLFDEFLVSSQLMVEQFGKEMGYEVKSLDAGNNAGTQISQLADIIPLNPIAIILYAVDSATIASSIEEANKAGIPILVFDRLVPDAKADLSSVVGTVKVGNMAADEAVRMLKEKYGEEKGVVLDLMGDPGDQYTVTIEQGFQDKISAYPNINVISKSITGWEPTTGANIVEDQITARKDIDIIFCHSDGINGPQIPVLENHGYKPGDIKIMATGGTPGGLNLIREGWMQVTITQPLVEQVYALWQFMDDVIANKELKAGEYDVKGLKGEMKIESWGPTIYLPGLIVNKDNVDDPTLWGNTKLK